MSALLRRIRTVPALVGGAVVLTIAAPVWLPIAALADLLRGRRRLPMARLLAFAWCWSWLETTGVAAAAWLWLTGRRGNLEAHYRLQRWWADRLMRALRTTTGVDVVAADGADLRPGPALLLCRHASLADSLVSAWVVTSVAQMNPRYVLKRELLADPCLDIVGGRLPNHFLNREATDSAAELAALSRLSAGLRADEVAVIFPEGTRATPGKRSRALEKIAQRDPARAARLGGLQHLLPPRPAGSAALLAGCPNADVVLAWHVGFDGWDNFGAILRQLAHRPPPVLFHTRRVCRAVVPADDEFTAWLDDQWLQIDRDVHHLINPEGSA